MKIKIINIECDSTHIIHRKGSEDYPTIRRIAVREDDKDNWEIVTFVDPEVTEAIQEKLKEIDEYDSSKAVNSFILNGNVAWLDKATRVGLMNSLNCEKSVGNTMTTLWLDTTAITINIDNAIQLLSALELYALRCYNVTAEHKKAVKSLLSIDEIKNYDFTVGYPEKLEINTQE